MNFNGQTVTLFDVIFGELSFPRKKLIRSFQLGQTDSCAYIGHSIIIADDIVPVLAVRYQSLPFKVYYAIEQNRIVCHDHSALASRNCLVPIETESCDVAKGSDVFAMIPTAKCFCAIFNYEKAVPLRNR